MFRRYFKILLAAIFTLAICGSLISVQSSQAQSPAALAAQPQVAAATQYGNMTQFWEQFCLRPPRTNLLEIIDQILALLSDLTSMFGDLSILVDPLQIPDISQCIPQLQAPNLDLNVPGLDGFLNCFGKLPDLSGLFTGIGSCAGSILLNIPSLAAYLHVNIPDINAILKCLELNTPQLPQISIPDLLGNLLATIEKIISLIGSLRVELPQIQFYLDWAVNICNTELGGRVAAASLPLTGATFGTSAAQQGRKIGLQVNVNSGALAQRVGTSVATAALGEAPAVSALVKDISVHFVGKARGKSVRKVITLKRKGGDTFNAKVDGCSLGSGRFRYSYLVTTTSGQAVVLPGGQITTGQDCR